MLAVAPWRLLIASLTIMGTLARKYDNWPDKGPWIVKLEEANHQEVIDKARMMHSRRLESSLDGGRSKSRFRVGHTLSDTKDFHAVVLHGISHDEIMNLDGVQTVSPDYPIYAQYTLGTPGVGNITADYNMSAAAKQYFNWGLERISKPNLPILGTAFSYDPSYTGLDVDLYVLDTGIDTLHIEFSNTENRVIQNIWNSFGPLSSNTDGFGHGTHVAALAGGKNTGAASQVSIYGMKVLSDQGLGSSSDAMAAMLEVQRRHVLVYGSSKKTVVNLSLSGSCKPACDNSPYIPLVDSLQATGIMVVVSAGNNAEDVQFNMPSGARAAITVASSTIDDERSYFSNYGSIVDLYAPGSDIFSACGNGAYNCQGESSFITLSGTSMSTPIVSGAVSQILQQLGSITMDGLVAWEQAYGELMDLSVLRIKQLDPAIHRTTTMKLLQIPIFKSQPPLQGPTVAPVTGTPTTATPSTAAPTIELLHYSLSLILVNSTTTELDFDLAAGLVNVVKTACGTSPAPYVVPVGTRTPNRRMLLNLANFIVDFELSIYSKDVPPEYGFDVRAFTDDMQARIASSVSSGQMTKNLRVVLNSTQSGSSSEEGPYLLTNPLVQVLAMDAFALQNYLIPSEMPTSPPIPYDILMEADQESAIQPITDAQYRLLFGSVCGTLFLLALAVVVFVWLTIDDKQKDKEWAEAAKKWGSDNNLNINLGLRLQSEDRVSEGTAQIQYEIYDVKANTNVDKAHKIIVPY